MKREIIYQLIAISVATGLALATVLILSALLGGWS